MENTQLYLAQFNIIKLKDKLDSPIVKEFRDFLAPVNQLAEESPGFIWRLKDDNGNDATDVETPYEDELIFVNMSVWEDYQSLKDYTYQTVHSYFLKSRKKWSTEMEGLKAVMWYIPKGEIPTVEQGKEKLEQLNNLGASPDAFSMKEIYDSNGLKI
ncbi:DUF3291 domain-containing protein [Marinigracilibium pacificum]|uniref:DUF3291 domain-containing protein n=1 Tax=Marinigracilibium pacificum TaxID=2729599 RepID=A0A848IVK0_9BACT|nr:DUF3291 domain-containing protein [Marinigracilibium pacificum]NMM47716.1 DUF3291 domain-containing protein [Marinigracilibium pacificum]